MERTRQISRSPRLLAPISSRRPSIDQVGRPICASRQALTAVISHGRYIELCCLPRSRERRRSLKPGQSARSMCPYPQRLFRRGSRLSVRWSIRSRTACRCRPHPTPHAGIGTSDGSLKPEMFANFPPPHQRRIGFAGGAANRGWSMKAPARTYGFSAPMDS